jgi:hypothetical protein
MCSMVRRHAAASDSVEMFERIYLGKEFTVERRTGLMAGVLKNGNEYTQPEVIDSGGAENSYKVVTLLRAGQGAGPGSGVILLTVNEFADGATMPFMYAETDTAFFGVCVHF